MLSSQLTITPRMFRGSPRPRSTGGIGTATLSLTLPATRSTLLRLTICSAWTVCSALAPKRWLIISDCRWSRRSVDVDSSSVTSGVFSVDGDPSSVTGGVSSVDDDASSVTGMVSWMNGVTGFSSVTGGVSSVDGAASYSVTKGVSSVGEDGNAKLASKSCSVSSREITSDGSDVE